VWALTADVLQQPPTQCGPRGKQGSVLAQGWVWVAGRGPDGFLYHLLGGTGLLSLQQS